MLHGIVVAVQGNEVNAEDGPRERRREVFGQNRAVNPPAFHLIVHQDRVGFQEIAFGAQSRLDPSRVCFNLLPPLLVHMSHNVFPQVQIVDLFLIFQQHRQRIRILPRCRFGRTGGMNIVAGLRCNPRRRCGRLTHTRCACGSGDAGFGFAVGAERCCCSDFHGYAVGWSYMGRRDWRVHVGHVCDELAGFRCRGIGEGRGGRLRRVVALEHRLLDSPNEFLHGFLFRSSRPILLP